VQPKETVRQDAALQERVELVLDEGWQARTRGGLDLGEEGLGLLLHQLGGTQALEFRGAQDDEGRYAWIESVLRRFDYRQLPRRPRDVFTDARFERLGSISVGHLYNLRNSAPYRAQRVVLTKTRPTKAVTIGVRKAPAPEGRPGFIRIDSVHQGDWDGVKGLYHINAVDCVTQWQVVATVQTISEAYLLPVIAQMPAQSPFEILGFHADNGSEYVNHRVAEMLDKLASLPTAETFLREGVTLHELHMFARALTDVQAAKELQEARNALLRRVPPMAG
jgi:hypothetical protein